MKQATTARATTAAAKAVSCLHSVGLAQPMMQSGMFMPARSFAASLSSGLLTHFKREEDNSVCSGKLDEQLSRMSEIVDHLDGEP